MLRAKKRIRVYMHLHPSPEIGSGEKRAALMKGGAVRITVLIGGEAVNRLRPRFAPGVKTWVVGTVSGLMDLQPCIR
jgi:hypothetical protein